jgi:Uma2 family endonuclease
MIAPAWMHEPITAEQYDSWSEEQCAGIEVVDGMVVLSASASKRHNRLVKTIAVALEAAAGPGWNADFDVDVRLQDVPLTNRRPDVAVYRADTIDVMPARPEHLLLVVEVVSPGSETTDRIVKAEQYATAGISYYWRVEQPPAGVPVVARGRRAAAKEPPATRCGRARPARARGRRRARCRKRRGTR